MIAETSHTLISIKLDEQEFHNIFDKYYGKNKIDIDEVITKINYIEDIGNGNEIILKPIINAVSKIKEIQRLWNCN